MSSACGGGEWGPAVRRSTAPSRPGLSLRRIVRSQPEGKRSSVSSTESVGSKLRPIQDVAFVRPSSASAAVVKVGKVFSSTSCEYALSTTTTTRQSGRKSWSTDETYSPRPRPGSSRMISSQERRGRVPEVKLKLTNIPVTLLEMKGTCRLNVEKCVDLDLNFEQISCEDKMEKELSASSASPADVNPVLKLSAKQKSFMDKEIRKKMGEQRLFLDATDSSGEAHQLEGRRQVVNNSLGRYFVIGRSCEGGYTAHSVQDWMLLEPSVKYKTLNSDEADVEFEKRDKTLNHFSIMVQKRLRTQDDSDEEENSAFIKKASRKKADPEDSWISSESEPESQDGEKSC